MRVSIVIPVYNEAAYLSDCLRSVAKQTVRPHEVIVVDNNSTDDSVRVARDFSFVKVVHERRQGSVFARNRGLDVATGDVIGRLDADARLAETWVERLTAAFAAHPEAAAVTGSGNFYDVHAGRFWGKLQILGYQKFQYCLAGTYFLWGCNMAITKAAWLKVRDKCSLRTDIDEDIDLSLCLKAAGLPIRFDPSLHVAASMLRGRHDPISVAKYLTTWPKDYLIHGRYVNAAAVLVFSCLMVVITLPAWLIELCLPASTED